MNSVRGKVAVVTGAGSGIGRALALELARRGARLALSDVNDTGLAQTAERAQALGAQVHTDHVDVSRRADVQAHASAVAERYGVIHQIYNNAGIAGGGRTVLETDWEVYERVLAINLFGVINGTKAFLPHLLASGDGHVVNISSLNGYTAQPTLSAYCASKFGVRGFTEVLRTEMIMAGSPVKVTTVHPGGVKTNIASAEAAAEEAKGGVLTAAQQARVRAYNDKLLSMAPEQAARIIVDGVEAGSARIRVGRDAKIADRIVRLLPTLYPHIVTRLERKVFGAS